MSANQIMLKDISTKLMEELSRLCSDGWSYSPHTFYGINGTFTHAATTMIIKHIMQKIKRILEVAAGSSQILGKEIVDEEDAKRALSCILLRPSNALGSLPDENAIEEKMDDKTG